MNDIDGRQARQEARSKKRKVEKRAAGRLPQVDLKKRKNVDRNIHKYVLLFILNSIIRSRPKIHTIERFSKSEISFKIC